MPTDQPCCPRTTQPSDRRERTKAVYMTTPVATRLKQQIITVNMEATPAAAFRSEAAEEIETRSWTCLTCTFANSTVASAALSCEMCGMLPGENVTPTTKGPRSASPEAAAPEETPPAPIAPVPPASTPVKNLWSANLDGTRVVRGPDWMWGDQDGGDGRGGLVVSGGLVGFVKVRWAAEPAQVHTYRAGNDGKFDLALARADVDCGTAVASAPFGGLAERLSTPLNTAKDSVSTAASSVMATFGSSRFGKLTPWGSAQPLVRPGSGGSVSVATPAPAASTGSSGSALGGNGAQFSFVPQPETTVGGAEALPPAAPLATVGPSDDGDSDPFGATQFMVKCARCGAMLPISDHGGITRHADTDCPALPATPYDPLGAALSPPAEVVAAKPPTQGPAVAHTVIAPSTGTGKDAEKNVPPAKVAPVCFCGKVVPVSTRWPKTFLGAKPLGIGRPQEAPRCAVCAVALCPEHVGMYSWALNASVPAAAEPSPAAEGEATGRSEGDTTTKGKRPRTVCPKCFGLLEEHARRQRQARWLARAQTILAHRDGARDRGRRVLQLYHERVAAEDTALAKAGRVVEGAYNLTQVRDSLCFRTLIFLGGKHQRFVFSSSSHQYIPGVSATVSLAAGAGNAIRQYGVYGLAGFMKRDDITRSVYTMRVLIGEEHLQGLSVSDTVRAHHFIPRNRRLCFTHVFLFLQVLGLYYLTSFRRGARGSDEASEEKEHDFSAPQATRKSRPFQLLRDDRRLAFLEELAAVIN